MRGELWDLNSLPDEVMEEAELTTGPASSEACSSERTSVGSKEKWEGSRLGPAKKDADDSETSSYAVVVEEGGGDGQEEEVVEEGGGEGTGSRRIFGFSTGGSGQPLEEGYVAAREQPELVTHQFFPMSCGEGEGGGGGCGGGGVTGASMLLPRAHLVGARFCDYPLVGMAAVGRTTAKAPHTVKKSRRGPRSRSSQYRGVTFYRRTGRWESHICAYDRAAIKFRGVDADINFCLEDYIEDMKQMSNLTKEEFVHLLRRQSTGFSRGSSKYRGVTLHKC
ncbi:hypothetical protein Taro_052071 [Colocasia esculenta]|uniref:AP2/ERF domain-containing protein n=1 Tax=Colocasia esculenta TaxID=4460 RepID=A0A843XIN3_COLES|nr:hypothetical protein [Colocasia esculenta]